jgi:hypothetical protein
MKLTIITGRRGLKHNAGWLAQNQIKKNDTQINPLFKKKKTLVYKKYINKIYVKFNCASNNKTIIFYFCKFIEYCLIKG